MRLEVMCGALSVFVTACDCAPKLRVEPSEPWVVSATRLDFPATWLTSTKILSVSVRNPNVTSRTVSLHAPAPFFLEGTLEVDAVETVRLDVTFAPDLAGPAPGTLVLADDRGQSRTVELYGEGLAWPDCGTAAPCHVARFDLAAGRCVDSALADDTDCALSYACFATAQCVAGECRGRVTTCDDANLCTTDVCSADGCGHLDATFDCPAATNPCKVPTCAAATGCDFEDLPDGTSCGARDCQSADICLAGVCVRRAAPQTQVCVEVLAGLPIGCGDVDGVGLNARLFPQPSTGQGLAAMPNGDLYVLGNQTVRRVTPGGVVTTLAGLEATRGRKDGAGSAARFDELLDLTAGAHGNLVVTQPGSVRMVSPAGVVRTIAGGGDAGLADSPFRLAQFGSPRSITAAPNGSFWLNDRGIVRELTAGGYVKRFSPSLYLGSEGSVLPQRDGGLLAADSAGRILRLDRGASSGIGAVLATVPWAGGQGSPDTDLDLTASGDLLFTRYDVGTIAIEPDGGSRVVIPVSERPLAVATVGDAIYYVSGCTLFRHTQDGGVLVAGAGKLATGSVDGPVTSARFDSPRDLGWQRDGGLWVLEYGAVRSVAGGRVETVFTSDSGSLMSLASFGETFAVTRGRSDVLIGPLGMALARVPELWTLSEASEGLIGVTTGGSILSISFDGGVTSATANSRINYVATLLDGGLVAGGTNGTWTLEADGGAGLTSRANASRLRVDPSNGDVITIGAGRYFSPRDRVVTRVAVDGTVTDIATLAQPINDLLVDTDGSIVVSVPGALLRIRR